MSLRTGAAAPSSTHRERPPRSTTGQVSDWLPGGRCTWLWPPGGRCTWLWPLSVPGGGGAWPRAGMAGQWGVPNRFRRGQVVCLQGPLAGQGVGSAGLVSDRRKDSEMLTVQQMDRHGPSWLHVARGLQPGDLWPSEERCGADQAGSRLAGRLLATGCWPA
jgi:hypothetical protein